MGRDLVAEIEAVIVDDDPESALLVAADVGDRDVVVVVQRVGKAMRFVLSSATGSSF